MRFATTFHTMTARIIGRGHTGEPRAQQPSMVRSRVLSLWRTVHANSRITMLVESDIVGRPHSLFHN